MCQRFPYIESGKVTITTQVPTLVSYSFHFYDSCETGFSFLSGIRDGSSQSFLAFIFSTGWTDSLGIPTQSCLSIFTSLCLYPSRIPSRNSINGLLVSRLGPLLPLLKYLSYSSLSDQELYLPDSICPKFITYSDPDPLKTSETNIRV